MKLLPLIFLFLFSYSLSAQDNEEEEQDLGAPTLAQERKFDLSKLYVGGNFGIAYSGSSAFGSALFMELSPDVAYRLNKYILVGAGIIYQYTQYFDPNQGFHVVGGRAYARGFVWDPLFVQIEGVAMNRYVDRDLSGNLIDGRKTYGNVLVGGGYQVNTGGNAYMTMTLLVPLIENELYPNRNPIVNFGFAVGLGGGGN